MIFYILIYTIFVKNFCFEDYMIKGDGKANACGLVLYEPFDWQCKWEFHFV